MMDIYKNPPVKEQAVEGAVEPRTVKEVIVGNGIYIYLEGEPYPVKGLPTQEATYAINAVKKLFLRGLKTFSWRIVISPRKTLKYFEDIGQHLLSPYFLKEEYQNPVTQELAHGIQIFCAELHYDGERIAEIISHIFEYDGAYRFRLQDLLNETNAEKLVDNPRKEILRLLEINRQRDYKEVSDKFGLLKSFTYLLLIPRLDRAIKKTVSLLDFTKLYPDEGDKYWMSRQVDYKYNG